MHHWWTQLLTASRFLTQEINVVISTALVSQHHKFNVCEYNYLMQMAAAYSFLDDLWRWSPAVWFGPPHGDA